MENNIVKIIKDLTAEQLKQYQDMIKFFALLGISEEDITNFVRHIRFQKEFEEKANMIIENQKRIDKQMNDLSMRIDGLKDPKYKNNLRGSPLEELNAETEGLKL